MNTTANTNTVTRTRGEPKAGFERVRFSGVSYAKWSLVVASLFGAISMSVVLGGFVLVLSAGLFATTFLFGGVSRDQDGFFFDVDAEKVARARARGEDIDEDDEDFRVTFEGYMHPEDVTLL